MVKQIVSPQKSEKSPSFLIPLLFFRIISSILELALTLLALPPSQLLIPFLLDLMLHFLQLKFKTTIQFHLHVPLTILVNASIMIEISKWCNNCVPPLTMLNYILFHIFKYLKTSRIKSH
jgi:hypothetical protein